MIDRNFFPFKIIILNNFKKFVKVERITKFIFFFLSLWCRAKKKKKKKFPNSMKTNFVVFFVVCRSTIFFREQERRVEDRIIQKALLASKFYSDRFEIVQVYLELSTNDNNNFGRSCSLAVYSGHRLLHYALNQQPSFRCFQ